MEQKTYLEKLLAGYKERFSRGERSLEPKIRHITAQLEQLKLKEEIAKAKPKARPSLLRPFVRSCCRGR